MNCIFSSAYLAPVSYYSHLYKAEQSSIEMHCHYTKQTFRNRCHIISSNGVLPLSIPVEKPQGKLETKSVRISNHDNWQHLHWNAIASAYGSSPFFEYYQDDLIPFYKQKVGGTFLVDFNEKIRETICQLIEINPVINFTPIYVESWEGIDLREKIHPKRSISEAVPSYHIQPYYQVFAQKHKFTPDLSIIDLLFNMGPEAILILNNNIK